CESLNSLDHRVSGSPSTAFDGSNVGESNALLLAVAGRWAARSVADVDRTRLPYTSNDHSEYPHWHPRRVPRILTERPVPARPVRSSTSPSPPVTVRIVVQVVASSVTCTW